MSLLSYNELVDVVDCGFITNVKLEQINAASIDITVGNVFFVEEFAGGAAKIGDRPEDRVPLNMRRVELEPGQSLILHPGEVALAQSEQVFHLPNWLSAEYKEKSSMGRTFLNHMMAGWCDAGWFGSVLTLELKNETKWHTIEIPVGVGIGQMIFHKHLAVPTKASYATKGRYNNDKTTQGVKP